MNFSDFKKMVSVSGEDICREILAENRKSIRVKKEETIVRNLSRIFEATLKISNKKGFQAMSMRDLSKEAGLSLGALYGYFSGKEEILEMQQHQGRTVIERILTERIGAETGPVQKLRAAIQTHLYLSEAMQPWFYFSYMEAKHLTRAEKEKAVSGELFTEKVIADILEAGRQQGVFTARDPQLTASVIKAMLQDWYLKRWKYSRRKISVDQYAAFVLDVVETFCITHESHDIRS